MTTQEQVLVSAAAGLFGVVLGVVLTFKLQAREAEKQERARRVRCVKHSIVAVTSQFNGLTNLWIDFLADFEKLPDRHREITMIGDHADHPFIDIDSLRFLIDIDQPGLLLEFELHNNDYQQVVGIVDHRNKCMEIMQQVCVQAGRNDQGELMLEVPEEHDIKIKMVTDSLYEATEKSIQSCRSTVGELQELLSTIDPKTRPLKVELPDINKAHVR
ncbi:MAG: hypothetical protein AAF085_05465 [Planctomycetota bacterium]